MDSCPVCGALYALVGRTHRCMSNIAEINKAVPAINKPVVKRDPVKYRAYMRAYMKRRRAK